MVMVHAELFALGTDVSDLIGPGQWEMHHENQRSPEDGS